MKDSTYYLIVILGNLLAQGLLLFLNLGIGGARAKITWDAHVATNTTGTPFWNDVGKIAAGTAVVEFVEAVVIGVVGIACPAVGWELYKKWKSIRQGREHVGNADDENNPLIDNIN